MLIKIKSISQVVGQWGVQCNKLHQNRVTKLVEWLVSALVLSASVKYQIDVQQTVANAARLQGCGAAEQWPAEAEMHFRKPEMHCIRIANGVQKPHEYGEDQQNCFGCPRPRKVGNSSMWTKLRSNKYFRNTTFRRFGVH